MKDFGVNKTYVRVSIKKKTCFNRLRGYSDMHKVDILRQIKR